MKYILLPIVFVFSLLLGPQKDVESFEEKGVAEILKRLGDTSIKHYPSFKTKNVSVENGRQLFHTGFATSEKGGRTKKQSKHFVCTSCHNTEREDPDLSVSDPQARLEYVNEKGLPFLQGTTLYGAVNRTNFYNGDYDKKYGDLVVKARNNIYEAIQLCAVECAQGRKLKQWELESILAYLWTIELKMKDLQLSDVEEKEISLALSNTGDKEAAIALIQSKYLKGSPATFIPPPEDRKLGEGYQGDPKNGKLVYDLSCKHCHASQRYSFFDLDDAKTTFQFLDNHLPKYSRYSIYQVTRWGTPPIPGKKAYMPHYTEEKLSKRQLQDLRAYIEQEAD